jgi:valyl-tRNA synthetase
VDKYGGKITNQLRRMGSSYDWTRQVDRQTDRQLRLDPAGSCGSQCSSLLV